MKKLRHCHHMYTEAQSTSKQTSGQCNLTQGRTAAAHERSIVFARLRQRALHLTHASLGPPESTS